MIPLFLAPMAGVGDRAFREVCASFGVGFFTTEMISAKAVTFGDQKSFALATAGEIARPFAVQLFGSEPDRVAAAAKIFGKSADWIDLNFGCPVPKIVKNGEGSALMKDPALAYEIVRAAVQSAGVPVSVKMRAGFDESHITAPHLAELCEKAGAQRITVRARCREDYYRAGTVRPSVIAEVKRAVSIPVVANGDIFDGESACRMIEETGCDALMIGRGALGAPWVFASIRAFLQGTTPPPVFAKQVLEKHLRLAFRYKPLSAGREMRAHTPYYLKGFSGAAELRAAMSHAETLDDYLTLLARVPEEI